MGKDTRTFKKTKYNTIKGNESARNFSQINRGQGLHTKVINFIKVRGKSIFSN